MKNIFKHATLCIVAVSIFFTTLFCMDNSDIGELLDDSQNVLFLLKHKLHYFDHHTLCSLAINKEWDKLLLDTAPSRRQDVMMRLQNMTKDHSNEYVERDVWHKYGSAYGTKMYCNCTDHLRGSVCANSVSLRVVYFGSQRSRSVSWGLTQEIRGLEGPKFDETGNFVCYGLEKKRRGNHAYKHVREYGMCSNISCWLLLENDHLCQNSIKLVPFKAFPHLLKAFLDALEVHGNKRFKFCDLQKVIIPDDYKECTPNDECKSYNELPEWWREIIDRRYQEQQKK